MPTFLITGGAGFIGSHLAEAALAQGHRVLVLDDLSSGNVENLSQIRSNPAFEFVPDSVANEYVLAELVDRADIVFHLAATVGVFNIIESPVATILNNIGGTEAVLKMAAKKRKTVLVVSTSEVYGKSQSVPFREDGDLVSGPTSIPMPGELRSVPREAGIIEPLAVVWTPRRNLAAIPPPYPRSLRRCHCPA